MVTLLFPFAPDYRNATQALDLGPPDFHGAIDYRVRAGCSQDEGQDLKRRSGVQNGKSGGSSRWDIGLSG